MDLELFQDSSSGDLVPISGNSSSGQPWQHAAFVPRPLGSEQPDLSRRANRSVAEARAALAALDATARQLPNPRLFRQQSLRVEAQATAALEGTYEPLAKVMAAQLNDDHSPSMREVLNFLDVADLAFEATEAGQSLTPSLLAQMQGLLMTGTAAEGPYSGRVRPIQVIVGQRQEIPGNLPPVQRARYVPPPPGVDLEARLADLLRWMDADHSTEIDPVVATAMAHYQFESLHPFHDGNGRLGRLLIVVHLTRCGVISEPTLTVSPWFESRRSAYYDALLGVSTSADWSTWVGFFAEGLAASARQTLTRMNDLSAAMADLKDQVRSRGIRTANALHLIDLAVDQVLFTTARAAATLGMKPQGAARLIASLQGIGVLDTLDDRPYNRIFHAPAVTNIVLGP